LRFPYSARLRQATERNADLEAGSRVEMPVVQDAAVFATGAHDQTD
jgi:hypothetical protein